MSIPPCHNLQLGKTAKQFLELHCWKTCCHLMLMCSWRFDRKAPNRAWDNSVQCKQGCHVQFGICTIIEELCWKSGVTVWKYHVSFAVNWGLFWAPTGERILSPIISTECCWRWPDWSFPLENEVIASSLCLCSWKQSADYFVGYLSPPTPGMLETTKSAPVHSIASEMILSLTKSQWRCVPISTIGFTDGKAKGKKIKVLAWLKKPSEEQDRLISYAISRACSYWATRMKGKGQRTKMRL